MATLAIGVGVTTALFSVLHQVLLRPLPYDRADQLVTLRSTVVAMGWTRIGVSAPLYLDLAAELSTMSGVAAYLPQDVNVGGVAEPVRVAAARASANVSSVLRTRPLLGRFLVPEETSGLASPAAVVSEGFWRQHLGAKPDVLASTILVDDVPHRVVGVMPDGFGVANNRPAIWTPLHLPPEIRSETRGRGMHDLTVVGRVRDDATIAQARADLARFNRWLAETRGDFYLPKFEFSVELTELQRELIGDARTPILLLAGATTLVLLIACANVANLLLFRSEARAQEFAVKLALGGSPRRLIAGLLIENLVLAVAAGVAGAVLAGLIVQIVVSVHGSAIPRVAEISVSWNTLAVAMTAAVLAAGAVALVPARRIRRLSPAAALRDEGRGGTASRTRARARTALVVIEVSLAFVLLVGSGLLLRSLASVLADNPGFDPSGIVATRLSLPAGRYGTAERSSDFFAAIEQRVVSLPGVVAAGLIDRLPLRDEADDGAYVAGTSWPSRGSAEVAPSALRHVVSSGYLDVARVRLVRGRGLLVTDRRGGLPVAVVNELLVRRHWPGGDPIGRQIFLFGDVPRTIVGVVAPAKARDLATTAEPEIYVPVAQWRATRTMSLVIRTSESSGSLVPTVRTVLRDIDPTLPAGEFTSMREVVHRSLARPRFLATLMTAFGTIALLLGAVGVYSVLSYTFELRAREVAVRIALGASAHMVWKLVLSHGMRLVATGLAAGGIAASTLASVLASTLYGVSPRDPLTFTAAVVVLVLAGLLACALPAGKAARRDPIHVLRGDRAR